MHLKGGYNMSRILVIYRSKYGVTKEYATYLGEHVGAEVKSYKDVTKKDIMDAQVVVFGGSIYVSRVAILKTVKRYQKSLVSKKVYLFTVGITETAELAISRIKTVYPYLDDYHFKDIFFYPGSMDITHMNWIHRNMLTMVQKMLSKKTDMTEDEKKFYDAITYPNNNKDMSLMNPLIEQLESTIYA